MIRLLKVELTRLRWRRAVMAAVAACLLIPIVTWVTMALQTQPPDADDLARAERMAAAEAEQPWLREEIANCEKDPEMYLGPDGGTDCVTAMTPQPENFLNTSVLSLEQVLTDQGLSVLVVLAMTMLVIGTTFAGHDWNTGSMSNQLLFESRRTRVWAGKAAAVMVAATAVAVVVLALFWGATALLAASRDIATADETWRDVLHTNLRAVPLVALAGLFGYAATMLFRNTVATLALGFGAAVGSSVLLMALFGEQGQRWLPSSNFMAVLDKGTTYYYWGPGCDGYDGGEACIETITMAQGSLYWGVIIVVLVALSVWSFRRRDLP